MLAEPFNPGDLVFYARPGETYADQTARMQSQILAAQDRAAIQLWETMQASGAGKVAQPVGAALLAAPESDAAEAQAADFPGELVCELPPEYRLAV